MPINNNQPTLLQCAICPRRLSCPWGDFPNNIKRKYCPVLETETEEACSAYASTQERNSLDTFLKDHLN